jgi:hypothetical protein
VLLVEYNAMGTVPTPGFDGGLVCATRERVLIALQPTAFRTCSENEYPRLALSWVTVLSKSQI